MKLEFHTAKVPLRNEDTIKVFSDVNLDLQEEKSEREMKICGKHKKI